MKLVESVSWADCQGRSEAQGLAHLDLERQAPRGRSSPVRAARATATRHPSGKKLSDTRYLPLHRRRQSSSILVVDATSRLEVSRDERV
jgi:hypothetical protein